MTAFQIVRQVWHGARATDAAERGGEKGLKSSVDHLLNELEGKTPLQFGALNQSARAEVQGEEAVISYDTPYAAVVHEHPEWQFQHGREGKWLERTLEGNQDAVLSRLGDALDRELR